jgi:thymidine phosphorylase
MSTPAAALVELIRAKMRGRELSNAGLRLLCEHHARFEAEVGVAPPPRRSGQAGLHHATALLAACELQGLSDAEVAGLACAMRDSGEVLRWPAALPSVSLYSGIGMKTSLIVAPICASKGVLVPKISDRSAVGGILDKLECVPGLDVRLSPERFQRAVLEVGCAVVAPHDSMAPAERSLRRAREFIGSSGADMASPNGVGLLAASVLCKKLACNTDAFLFDVKAGGSLSADAAGALASQLVRASLLCGKRAAGFVTAYQPLGRAIGGSRLELLECVGILRGTSLEGAESLRDNAALLSAQALLMSGRCSTLEEGLDQAIEALESGRALAKLEHMVRAQGGDVAALSVGGVGDASGAARTIRVYFDEDSPELLPPVAANENEAAALGEPPQRPQKQQQQQQQQEQQTGPADFHVASIDAHRLGRLGVLLGGARGLRPRSDQPVPTLDPQAGILLSCGVASPVRKGSQLCTLFTNKRDVDEMELAREARKAFTVRKGQGSPHPHILAFVSPTGELRPLA